MREQLVIYGDSISNMAHGDGGYQPLLKQSGMFASITTEAFGGSGLSRTTPHSMTSLLEDASHIHPEASMILIWHGSNDWFHGTPPGRFEHDLYQAHKTLKTMSPSAVVVFLTPIPRHEAPAGCATPGLAFSTLNKAQQTLSDYAGIIRRMAGALDAPLIDMASDLSYMRFGMDRYYEDGVHPNGEGNRLIADVLLGALKRLI